jgi:hypothetical protein
LQQNKQATAEIKECMDENRPQQQQQSPQKALFSHLYFKIINNKTAVVRNIS